MAEVTEADREKAMQIMAWDPLTYEGLAQAVKEGGDADDRESLELVDAIADALAEERKRAYNQGALDGMKLAREHREVTE